ncbi:hypothetical protein [Sutcliffiella cohnii]|uniref:hypothetical protein n=1 Tax=Sutcliffiella cohnii TaxID=33932 RepID=UPI0012EE6882|nr:hypothetical protein [Sutcliffiella cohnii]
MNIQEEILISSLSYEERMNILKNDILATLSLHNVNEKAKEDVLVDINNIIATNGLQSNEEALNIFWGRITDLLREGFDKELENILSPLKYISTMLVGLGLLFLIGIYCRGKLKIRKEDSSYFTVS